MTLPDMSGAYCARSDVEAVFGRPLPEVDEQAMDIMILSASDCIDGFVNTDIVVDPVTGLFPGVVVRVAAEVVANLINRPQPATPDNVIDPYNSPAFQFQIGPSSLGPWLNQSQQDRLDVLRVHARAMTVESETTGYFVRDGITGLSTSSESLGP